MRLFISGDKHGDFVFRNIDNACRLQLHDFCKEQNTTKDDVMVLLGDSGFNYHSRATLKNSASQANLTFFCIHGNHEERPENISTYSKEMFYGAEVYIEAEYPNIKFAISGNTYTFPQGDAFVVGGAYSVDKSYRLRNGFNWFPSEQLTLSERANVLHSMPKKVKYVFTHTCPFEDMPKELFLPSIDQSKVDNSMERFLSAIKASLSYEYWYFGHFHDNKTINDKMTLLHDVFIELS